MILHTCRVYILLNRGVPLSEGQPAVSHEVELGAGLHIPHHQVAVVPCGTRSRVVMQHVNLAHVVKARIHGNQEDVHAAAAEGSRM